VKSITFDLQIIERRRFKMKVYFKGWLTVLALALAALVIIILATQPIRAAGPWYVAPGGSDGNDCLSPGTACATINGALGKADPGDTIYVATGTYTGTGWEVVRLNKNVTLSGGWDGTFTTQSGTSTIDGEDARQGIVVNSGVTAIVECFTIRNGVTGSNGGDIHNSGTLTLNSITVQNGFAARGGGIYNDGGTLTLNNSAVSGNTIGLYGGGIYASGGTLTLNSSAVTGNTAGAGGGIFNNAGSILALNNSTVSGNTASAGGGFYIHSGTVILNSSTVASNTAISSAIGGGIRQRGGTVTLQSTIVAGNTATSSGPDCSGTISSAGYNLIGDTSGCTFTPTTGDLTNIDAKLGPLQDNGGPTETHALLPGSPAIDHIPPGNCTVPTDQRGVARPQPAGGNCDIGAYELEQEPTIMVSIDVKPGSDPNSINCNNEKEVIAVAILTTEDFDATTVDHTTVTFEGASETHVDKKSGEPRRHEEDVDGDGDTDLVFHFRLGDTDLTCDSIEGTLTGETFDGQAIKGTDAVRMIERGGGQP
jgi:hypothetical protein